MPKRPPSPIQQLDSETAKLEGKKREVSVGNVRECRASMVKVIAANGGTEGAMFRALYAAIVRATKQPKFTAPSAKI